MRQLLQAISTDPQLKQSKDSILLAVDEYPDVLDDVTYIASDLLARRLELVFGAKDERAKLAAYAALGKAVADVVARKADEAGEEWVDEGWSDGLFKEYQEGR